MQVYPNRLKSELANGLRSCYLIFGEEPQQKLSAIEAVRTIAKSNGFDERLSFTVDNQFNWSDLIEATQAMSLFTSRQLIELELPTAKPGTEGSKILCELAANPNPDVMLVVHGGKAGRDVQNTKWFKQWNKLGVFVPCYPLEGRALQQWITQQCQQAALSVDLAGIKLLSDFCEGNLLAARQEIEKLALLYPSASVTVEQIEASVVDQSRFNVFQLIDVLLAGEAQKCVKMLYRLESEGLEPTIVIWALTREWQTLQKLMVLKSRNEPINWNSLRIWKNKQPLYLNALSRLDASQLELIGSHLATVDKQIKQTTVSRPYVVLCHLCLLFIPMPLSAYSLE